MLSRTAKLSLPATGMIPYTFREGECLIIGLNTWGGSGTEPARKDATRQLFKLIWDWAAAIG